MFDCNICLAKEKCSAAVEKETFLCKIIRYRYGGTQADEIGGMPDIKFCQYCGSKLDSTATGRKFCKNACCKNSFRFI